MTCARVIRGISSMANNLTPVLASASSPSASENGSSMPISAAPFFIALTIAASGRRTVSTMSASPTASASLPAILAPAAAYSSSEIRERSPAPERMVTAAPALASFLTVSGVTPIRGSSSFSAGTPIAIISAPSPSHAKARLAPVLRPKSKRKGRSGGQALGHEDGEKRHDDDHANDEIAGQLEEQLVGPLMLGIVHCRVPLSGIEFHSYSPLIFDALFSRPRQ